MVTDPRRLAQYLSCLFKVIPKLRDRLSERLRGSLNLNVQVSHEKRRGPTTNDSIVLTFSILEVETGDFTWPVSGFFEVSQSPFQKGIELRKS